MPLGDDPPRTTVPPAVNECVRCVKRTLHGVRRERCAPSVRTLGDVRSNSKSFNFDVAEICGAALPAAHTKIIWIAGALIICHQCTAPPSEDRTVLSLCLGRQRIAQVHRPAMQAAFGDVLAHRRTVLKAMPGA